MNHVVIIEDNQELAEFVADIVKTKLDMTTSVFTTGVSAMQSLQRSKPNLVLVDLQLEDIRGETICSELRKKYADLPIIVITGDKSTASIVSCLEMGADDYITKPFNVDELIARIHARLRAADSGTNATVLSAQDITLNTETLEAARANEPLDLTAKEFELLHYLLKHKEMILPRDKILAAVWGYRDTVDTRVVDVHIGKLRRKLSPGSPEAIIRTVRGFGYKITD